jgi:hypothetical protein
VATVQSNRSFLESDVFRINLLSVTEHTFISRVLNSNDMSSGDHPLVKNENGVSRFVRATVRNDNCGMVIILQTRRSIRSG